MTDGVCDRLAAARRGSTPVGELVERWYQQGVLVPRDRPGDDGAAVVRAAGRSGAGRHRGGPTTADAGLLRAAAEAYEMDDLPFPAVRAFARAGAHREVERLLAERGAEMVCRGDARGVADLMAHHPLGRTPAVRRTHADALRRPR